MSINITLHSMTSKPNTSTHNTEFPMEEAFLYIATNPESTVKNNSSSMIISNCVQISKRTNFFLILQQLVSMKFVQKTLYNW